MTVKNVHPAVVESKVLMSDSELSAAVEGMMQPSTLSVDAAAERETRRAATLDHQPAIVWVRIQFLNAATFGILS